MNDPTTTKSPSDVHSLVRSGPEEACLEACKQPGTAGIGAIRFTPPADRGDAIHQIAANLERLAIEYDCQGRVSPLGVERRAVWAQFKAQIEALKGMA